MMITQLKTTVIDKLWILWSLCLVKHYQETGKATSPYNIIEEFGERNWRMFRIACETASPNLIDYDRMQLTRKGLAATESWKAISLKLFDY